MSLFSRNKNEEAAEADDDLAELDLDDDDEEVSLNLDAADVADEEEGGEPDATEQMVRELYDRLGQLSSNVEERFTAHAVTTDKLNNLEEQMRKLSSLTEAISARYNPFLGEAEEEQQDYDPRPTADQAAEVGSTLEEPVVENPPPEAEIEETYQEAPPDEEPAVADVPAMELARPAEEEAHEAPLTVDVTEVPLDEDEPEAFHGLNDSSHEPGLHEDGEAVPGPGLARVEDVTACFTASQVMMRWANLLMSATGSREGVADVVGHYQRIGWLGDEAGASLLEYVDGLNLVQPAWEHHPGGVSAQVHEMSLLYVERLADHFRGCPCRGRR